MGRTTAVLDRRNRVACEGRRRHLHAERAHRQPELTLVQVTPVPRRELVTGAVVRVPVPYADRTGWKTRPVVVLAADDYDILVWPVTTSLSRRPGEEVVELDEWAVAGMSQPCRVRRCDTFVVRREVIELMGHISPDDCVALGLSVVERTDEQQ